MQLSSVQGFMNVFNFQLRNLVEMNLIKIYAVEAGVKGHVFFFKWEGVEYIYISIGTRR